MINKRSDPSSLWTRCRHHEQNPSSKGSARLWHSSVLEPGSLRVWIIGGIINDLMQPDQVVSISGIHTWMQSWDGRNEERGWILGPKVSRRDKKNPKRDKSLINYQSIHFLLLFRSSTLVRFCRCPSAPPLHSASLPWRRRSTPFGLMTRTWSLYQETWEASWKRAGRVSTHTIRTFWT